jgi:23S rRNA (uracil1939-C5)-methyltransferase
MGRKKLNNEIIPEVKLLDASSDGNAVGKVGEKVVFVKYGVPGDVVDVKIIGDKRRFYEGVIEKIIEKSPDRRESFCKHFGICGGCKWQNLSYEKQLFYKEKQVKDAFERIGHLTWKEWLPINGSKSEKEYRNKLEFTFSQEVWLDRHHFDKSKEGEIHPALGFHAPGRFDKALNIDECFLMDDINNKIRNSVREFALKNDFPFFHIKKQEGWLRNMVIRTTTTGEIMLILIFFYEDEANRIKLLKHIQDSFPPITSLLYIINGKKNDSYSDQTVHTFSGKDYITEKMNDLHFRISPKAFFQTNNKQAIELYQTAFDFAELTGEETVYDLYTGTGTIANFIAKKAKNVIGIEYVPEAIEDAKTNSEINGIKNTTFYAGDMKDILTTQMFEKHGHPNVIITDPPRAGMHEDVVYTILNAAPDKIVYVSCNPATQARDLAFMKGQYEIVKVQPVDMFPQTHHVENVVLLKRLKNVK